MAINPPVGEGTSKACRSAIRDDFDKLVREAAMSGWSTKQTADALAELAAELSDHARIYQHFSLMRGPEDKS